MISLKNTLITFSFILGASFTFAQSISGTQQGEETVLDTQLIQNSGLLLTQTNASTAAQTNAAIGNSVFIQQVGTDNAAQVNVRSVDNTRVELSQFGNSNVIDVQGSSPDLFKSVEQIGNNNSVEDISLTTNLSTSFQLIQRGNDLKVEKLGVNSLTKDLKLTMTGSSRTVIIRSF